MGTNGRRSRCPAHRSRGENTTPTARIRAGQIIHAPVGAITWRPPCWKFPLAVSMWKPTQKPSRRRAWTPGPRWLTHHICTGTTQSRGKKATTTTQEDWVND